MFVCVTPLTPTKTKNYAHGIACMVDDVVRKQITVPRPRGEGTYSNGPTLNWIFGDMKHRTDSTENHPSLFRFADSLSHCIESKQRPPSQISLKSEHGAWWITL